MSVEPQATPLDLLGCGPDTHVTADPGETVTKSLTITNNGDQTWVTDIRVRYLNKSGTSVYSEIVATDVGVSTFRDADVDVTLTIPEIKDGDYAFDIRLVNERLA